jgi:hypothetical protein
VILLEPPVTSSFLLVVGGTKAFVGEILWFQEIDVFMILFNTNLFILCLADQLLLKLKKV